jgi:uncharacterized protein
VIYLIDGYNLLFSSIQSSKDFRSQREELILYLQNKFASKGLSGLLIFDGSHRREEESGRNYTSPLEIIYSPKGQTADSFILEKIELTKNRKAITVITNDAGLIRQARGFGANVQGSDTFIKSLHKNAPKKEKEFRESPKNIEKLLKIFEERFREDKEI